MLRYKCDGAGAWFREIDERYSTQECHACHERTGPKGPAGLAVRAWSCSHCGTQHLRDHNAALNIRERGLQWLEQQFNSTTPGETHPPGQVLSKAFEPLGSKVAAGRGRLSGILGL